MSAPSRTPAGDRLVTALQAVFGDRLLSIAAYASSTERETDGRLSCLALVETLTVRDLESCAAMAHVWQRERIATPLLLPIHEFRRSLDAFPLEYAEIQRGYTRLFGSDPFAGVAIEHADLRRACETQVKSHLLHLREGFIEAAGSPRAVGELVSTAAPAFASLLRNIAWLQERGNGDESHTALEVARLTELPEAVVAEILSLEKPSAIAAADAARLFPAYLATVERLAQFVDHWRG